MKLYLYGHEYKYAVEQMLLTLLPDQRPEYPEGRPRGDRMELRLSRGGRRCTASCLLVRQGRRYHGRAWAERACMGTGHRAASREQRLVKNAMYRAALQAGITPGPWGALTGVRPGKLLCALRRQGLAPESAMRRFREEFSVSPERARLCLEASEETLRVQAALRPEDVCLYVGIPFCPTRCAYCSFVSQSVEKSMGLMEPFLEALDREMSAAAGELRRLGLRVTSLYMGGGTPTTLSAGQLDRLCACLAERFDLSALTEYTVEAGRPDTITPEKLRVLRRHGADRISVNPQSMSDRVLEAIGRRHTAAAVEEALAQVRSVGGFEVNMDLIAGLPEDSPEGFRQSLRRVLALRPENITVHTLSLKKGSRISLEGTRLPDGESVAAMLETARELLRAAGYAPYYLYRQKYMAGGFENVGWTLPGHANRYNICIMEELCSIIALGGGGSTKLIHPGGGQNIRLMAPKYPLEYIKQVEKTCADKEKIGAFFRQAQTKEEA